MTRAQKGIKATILTIAVNMALAFIKVFTGIIGNTYALIADGIESITDIFSSIIVFGGFKIGSKPPDANHPWGHGKAESLAALFVSLILCLVAAGIAVHSIKEIVNPHQAPAPYTLVVLVVVIITKELMFRFLTKKSKDLDSLALEASAWDSRSDSLTSLAAFIGIGTAVLGGEKYMNADDWAALFASGIILFNGVRIMRSATDELMDTIPGPEVIGRIRTIAKEIEGIVDVEKCLVRQSGSGLFLEIHIEVNGDISVSRGHEMAHQVKDALLGSDLKIIDAVVHVEPAKRAS
ncbi:MAG: cation transporter [Candidatus Omnitrophica bacterium]|nr:cation transporter [Candidatus Omnitrophota bacterium]